MDEGAPRVIRRYYFPLWLIFPLMFFIMRAPFFWGTRYQWHAPNGAYGNFEPGILAAIPLIFVGILVVRFAVPLIDSAVRPHLHRPATAPPLDDQHTRRLELDLIDAHRRIRELEDKVAWQSRLLESQRPPSASLLDRPPTPPSL